MGIPVLLYGKSGAGKSRSLKGFGSEEITLFNVLGKQLPFPGQFKYTVRTDSYKKILKAFEKLPTKTVVIDDAGYLLTNTFMRGHALPKSGSSTFDLYNDIADRFWDLIMAINQHLPEDIIVYIIMHEAVSDYGEVKLKTIGKLLDEKVCIEGMVPIALRCLTDGERHYFRTQADGKDISKSPEGMFPLEIDNDLKLVDTTIREYYGLTKTGGNRNDQEA